MHRRISIVSVKETVRISALAGVIALGAAVQFDSALGLDLAPDQDPRRAPYAQTGGEVPHWLTAPVTVDVLAPYLG